jgi:hypothetical protein
MMSARDETTMSSITISSIVFANVIGGAMFGIFIRATLPQHHLSADSKDVVKLGMGLVATLSALVLGLLIASAKGSYDAQSNELNPDVRERRKRVTCCGPPLSAFSIRCGRDGIPALLN